MKKYIHELLKRKDLLIYLVISGLKAQYRNTFLGYSWWILDPLLMGIVYYFVRIVIFGMKGENIGAFLIIGLLGWKWIASSISSSSKSISGKAKIITQVYLPKVLFPLGTSMAQLFNFTFGLVTIAVAIAFYRIVPGIELLWLPVIMIIQFIFLSAISLVIGYYSVFVRDIENVLTHLMRFWFYGTPVIWEADRIPERYSWIIDVNPAAILLNSYRNIFMYGEQPELDKLFIIGFFSVVVLIYMLYFYSLNEHKIIKVL